MNTCSEGQVVCHDGSGFKSPLLQFTYNQSVWGCLSSTFQMMCKLSRDDVCTDGPRLYYRAIYARDQDKVTSCRKVEYGIVLPKTLWATLQKEGQEQGVNRGTIKYSLYFADTTSWGACELRIHSDSLGYMLYEGNSCMYGGLYVVHSNSSTETEILSLCTSMDDNYLRTTDLKNVSVVFIHYCEYLIHNIKFYAFHNFHFKGATTMQFDYDDDCSLKYKEYTLSILFPNTTKPIHGLMIFSNLLKLRKIHYINICCDALFDIQFLDGLRTSCINITIFYFSHASNIKGRQYNQETIQLRNIFPGWFYSVHLD